MKKIINGKKYNTETAAKIGNASFGNRSDCRYYSEELYKKKTGEFFLYGEGGPMSRYSAYLGNNGWGWGEEIIPLTIEEAVKWCEVNLDVDEFEELFGEVEE